MGTGYRCCKKIGLCLLILCFFMVEGQAHILKRREPKSFSSSVVVPCHHLHAKYLKRLCENYSRQTSLPDEMVISLSGCRYVDWEYVEEVRSACWPFNVKFVFSDDNKTEAQNRNLAAKAATKDILICQDADDLAHPQRVEIIKYYFNKYDIVHLIHLTAGVDDEFSFFSDISKIEYFHVDRLDQLSGFGLPFANGPVALLASLMKKMQWDETLASGALGADMRFNSLVYQKYKKTIAVPARIYRYFWAIDSIYINHSSVKEVC